MTTPLPYGSWRSPITADLLVERAVSLSYPMPQGDDIMWLEMRPSEAGRYVIVRRTPDGTISDVLPEGFSARTLAHEYGGLAHTVSGDSVFFSNFSDQRLYRLDPGGEPQPLTPEPPEPMSVRYADPAVSPDGRWVVCVPRAAHRGGCGQRNCSHISRRDRRPEGPVRRPRLLLRPAPRPCGRPAGLGELGPPQYAMGWYRAVGGAHRSRLHAGQTPPGGGGP